MPRQFLIGGNVYVADKLEDAYKQAVEAARNQAAAPAHPPAPAPPPPPLPPPPAVGAPLPAAANVRPDLGAALRAKGAALQHHVEAAAAPLAGDLPAGTNLFLLGHGFLAPQPELKAVPEGMTLIFYCKEKGVFDDSWEADVNSGAALADGYKPKTKGGNDPNWQHPRDPLHPGNTVNANEMYKDHLLVHPGGVQSVHPLGELKQISAAADGSVTLPAAILDRDTLYVRKDLGVGSAYLSKILAQIAGAGLAAPITVHWCACREDYDNEKKMASINNAFFGKREGRVL